MKDKNIWRKVHCRLWQEPEFCQLSPIPPCGRGLFLMLLTGPHTCAIPGLSRVGRAALAEQFEWSLEAFDQAFNEVSALGLVEADWKARLLWIPSAIVANPPQSLNAVTGWAAEWSLTPDCPLKCKAFIGLKSVVWQYDSAFKNAFTEAIPMPSGMASLQPSVIQKEKEKEKENLNEQKNSNLNLNEKQNLKWNEKREKESEEKPKSTSVFEEQTTLPTNYSPTKQHLRIADQLRLNCDHHFAMFVKKQKGKTSSDWDQDFERYLKGEL